jgi:hypothetical protein
MVDSQQELRVHCFRVSNGWQRTADFNSRITNKSISPANSAGGRIDHASDREGATVKRCQVLNARLHLSERALASSTRSETRSRHQ